jgi:hypothetical protein
LLPVIGNSDLVVHERLLLNDGQNGRLLNESGGGRRYDRVASVHARRCVAGVLRFVVELLRVVVVDVAVDGGLSLLLKAALLLRSLAEAVATTASRVRVLRLY